MKKLFVYPIAFFGFFDTFYGIFLFVVFENSPLFPATSKNKSTRKKLSNNHEIELTSDSLDFRARKREYNFVVVEPKYRTPCRASCRAV